MIIFETRLQEIVNLLPVLSDGSKVRYDWGTIDKLNQYLTVIENKSKYPLIWLLESKNNRTSKVNSIERKATIVIATKSVKPSEFNNYIFKKDFIDNLSIICDNLITAFYKSGISYIKDGAYSYEFKENYSILDNGNGVIDIWNVIVLEADIVINDKCINQIIKF